MRQPALRVGAVRRATFDGHLLFEFVAATALRTSGARDGYLRDGLAVLRDALFVVGFAPSASSWAARRSSALVTT